MVGELLKLAKEFEASESDIGLFEAFVPKVNQPFVDTWACVKVVPFITKLKPIGIPLK